MKAISTKNAPQAIGPYSQGYVSNGFVFTSGQIAIVPSTGEIIEGGIEEQAEQVCKNVCAALEAGGSSADNVVKTTCFLSDMGDFAKFNQIYEKYFPSKPARSCVAVKTLPKNVLCEVEAIGEA
ncbi:Rid family detoxifying hydrolase [Treponema sp.]|uniref:Rid family detoxifying hydrolase n=1 Tax=Treponema sp. TaxID=166 RepID=UPI00388FE6E9